MNKVNFERTIDLSVDNSFAVQITVAFTEHDQNPDEFRVEVRKPSSPTPVGVAVWHVRENDAGFSLQITTQSVASGVCLAGCFAGIITGPLVVCLKRAKTRKQVRDCITQHGFWQVVNSVSCIYACLTVP